jgi:toxin CcdB
MKSSVRGEDLMPQRDVYPNPSSRSRNELPYLVDVQSELLSALGTRFVVPLSRQVQVPTGLPRRMTPLFDVQNETLRLVPQEGGAIAAVVLRQPVVSLRPQSRLISDALDAVVSGV